MTVKMKALVGASLLFIAGLGNVAYASIESYYPPERINCRLNEANRLTCDGFNREVLTEDTTTVDFPAGKDEMLGFHSAVAYFTPDHNQATLFFTYHNAKQKMVKLKTMDVAARPDMTNGSWKKFKDDIYTCHAGYMNCSFVK
jgi:hypothetical protein